MGEAASGGTDDHVVAGLGAGYAEAVRAFRRGLVLARLREHRGSAAAAAASLRISAPTFYRYWSDARRS
jgi:DNA-binding NtrC family response regulator